MTRSMINAMDDSLFSILVDESCNNSIKEQMTVVLRFVDKRGQVKERLLGIFHIAGTCAQSLKDVIHAMFSTHGLSISSLRGQGYDGESNMSRESNGLNALILRENPCAMYIHCFAHQFQLAIVSVAHRNVMRLNIEDGGTDVLENISEDDISLEQNLMAVRQMDTRQDFQFVFSLHYNMRDNGKDTLLSKVIKFCVDRHITVPNMDDSVVLKDSILQELNDIFSEITYELFTCISCLNLRDSFVAFDVCKLVRLAQIYHLDFNSEELLLLKLQFDKLITLVLILTVMIASVERVFSAMNLVKNYLRNKMGDELLNDNLVVYMEKYLFIKLENDAILQCFQNMRPRKIQLSKFTIT
ncbi:uncharacterized protein LOC111372980, partial [Olea europaea var. sylvestris]|uniref:uncharacterized protein LOC111372980 n=1 Tax=Olea europaea var. sylvestris TaxID=158386 RepID=UPI000C1CD832